MKLHLREEPVEIQDRTFILREMSAEDQDRFYTLIFDISKAQQAWEEHNRQGRQDSSEARQVKADLETANLRCWQLMLVPTDNKGEITQEWLKVNTNSRFGDAVVEKQLELNNFSQTLGKLAVTERAKAAQAGLSDGPIFAAQSPVSTT